MNKFFRSFLKSFASAFSANESVIHFQNKYPRFSAFVKKRISTVEPRGFSFSVGIAVSILSFLYFIGIAQDVLSQDPFVAADIRIVNLVAALRNMSTANVLLFFTYLGNWQVIVSFGVVILIILWLLRRKRMAVFFFGAVASGELVYTILKQLLHRVRPDIGFSLISQSGYAFPSGHATVSIIFYGMIGFFLWRVSKRRWQKLIIVIATITLVFLIGFSRIYLGVHWSSDVIAGCTIGFSVLMLFVTYYHEIEKFSHRPEKEGVRKSFVIMVGLCLVFLEATFIYFFYHNHPLEIHESQQSPIVIIAPTLENLQSIIQGNNFSKYSETLVGQKMEPINFIIVSSKENLIHSFQQAGWLIADEPNASTLWHIAVAAVLNQNYPTAPVTPSFLNAQPDTIAFEKPTDANTVRVRHHVRFWLTNFRYGTTIVWVATASFDQGIRYFITHSIQPDVDTERDFIKDELLKIGSVEQTQELQLVPRLLGQNQSEDQFFTDGKAYIMLLR